MADHLDIYQATLACHQIFRDSGAVPILQEWAENCLADLNLWANGAGALKVGKASLDDRLSSNQDAKTFVVNLLGMLQAFVGRCIEEGRDVHGDGLDQAMQDVKSIIGQLTIITTSIRKAGINSRIPKADASYDPGHPQIEALCHHLQLLLLARPSEIGTLRARATSQGMLLVSSIDDAVVADSHSLTVIQRRLIEANLKRRNRFLYAQRHAMKMSEREPVPSTLTPALQKTPLPTVLNIFGRATEMPELPKVHSTTTEAQGPISLPTGTSAQPTTTVIPAISSRVTYPKPPAIVGDQNVFQCPCCCQILSTSMSRGSQWKKHLSRDILPYICIVEDCPHPERLYHTKDLWLSHMFTDHGGVSYWVCLACNDPSERPVFYEESALTEHLERKHSKGIKPQQISMLASAWLRKTPVTIRSCPLCEFKNQDSDAVLNHVAEHLHSFSLRSLPWAARDGESNGDLYDGYYQDHPYFETQPSVDRGSAGSISTKSSEPRDLQGLPVIDSDEGPTEDNQLTEEKIHGLVKDPSAYKDMLDVFLAGIESQEPLQEPFPGSRSSLSAPSDSESATDEENYDPRRHRSPSSSAILGPNSDDEPPVVSPPDFSSPSVSQDIDQHPHVEGPGRRVPFSLEPRNITEIPVACEGGNLVLKAGRIAGVRENNQYKIIMPRVLGVPECQEIGIASVTRITYFEAFLEMDSHTNLDKVTAAGLCAILVKDFHPLFPVSVSEDLKDHPSFENCRHIRPVSTDNYEMPFAYINTAHKTVSLLNTSRQVCASFGFGQSNKANAVGKAVQQAEYLSRAGHLLNLKAGIAQLLNHKLRLTFRNITHDRDLVLDGTANITAGDRIILKLENEGNETIYVSVFSINVAGTTSLVSSASPRGIFLPPDGPGKCYVLGQLQFHLERRGLEVTWPKNLPATRQQSVPEYLICIVSSAAVDLRCLESHSRDRELRGNPSQLEQLAYELSYRQGRDCGAEGLPDIRWDLIVIPFNLYYSH